MDEETLYSELRYLFGPFTVNKILKMKDNVEIIKMLREKKILAMDSYKLIEKKGVKLRLDQKKCYIEHFKTVNNLIKYYDGKRIQAA